MCPSREAPRALGREFEIHVKVPIASAEARGTYPGFDRSGGTRQRTGGGGTSRPVAVCRRVVLVWVHRCRPLRAVRRFETVSVVSETVGAHNQMLPIVSAHGVPNCPGALRQYWRNGFPTFQGYLANTGVMS